MAGNAWNPLEHSLSSCNGQVLVQPFGQGLSGCMGTPSALLPYPWTVISGGVFAQDIYPGVRVATKGPGGADHRFCAHWVAGTRNTK